MNKEIDNYKMVLMGLVDNIIIPGSESEMRGLIKELVQRNHKLFQALTEASELILLLNMSRDEIINKIANDDERIQDKFNTTMLTIQSIMDNDQ